MRFRHLAVLVAALATAAPAYAAQVRDGFNGAVLPPNDDDSTGVLDLGFTANFFGVPYTQLFVNNNGNVTFGFPLAAFTPFGLTGNTEVPIIAPFFADVDTSGAGSSPVTYGAGTVNGRAAFGVNYLNVGCFNQIDTVKNSFQVVLIDRADTGTGNFDIEFNYNSIQWEEGQFSGGSESCQGSENAARAGFSNGTGAAGSFFELNGSGVNGAFLDANLGTGLKNNSAGLSAPVGRYVYQVRNGNPAVTLAINDKITPPTPGSASYSATPVPGGPGGSYMFSAQYCRAGSNAFFDVLSQVTALSNNNNLISRTSDGPIAAQPGGPGARQDFALANGYADGLLSPGECTTETYRLGLSTRSNFTFRVQIMGTQQ